MRETPRNPTLLIGLGALGRTVAQLVVRQGPGHDGPREGAIDGLGEGADDVDRPPAIDARGPGEHDALAVILVAPAAAPDPLDEIAAAATTACERLLDLSRFVGATAPTDARGPAVDVFVIADLGDESGASLVVPLVDRLTRELRERFRPILRAGDGQLAVCPLVSAPRGAPRPRLARVISGLAALDGDADRHRRPGAQVYVLEDQSGKYVLSAAELARSLAAFLHLVLYAELRDTGDVRRLIERRDGDAGGPLATVACATLEVDVAAIHRLCATSLARDVLAAMAAEPIALSTVAEAAAPLVPEETALDIELSREVGDGSLEDYLAPPRVHVPAIDWRDEPEDIIDDKLGPLWRADTARVIEQFRIDVERLKMDGLARRIERNGIAELRARRDALAGRLRALATASPQGPHLALEVARQVEQRARARADDTARRTRAPDLRPLPPSPLDERLAALDDAVRARPRRAPFRMRLVGTIAAVVAAVIVAGLVHALLEVIGRPQPPWVAAVIGAALAGSYFGYALWGHLRRHHNWVVAAASELDQALVRHLRDDIVDDFRRRLAHSRQLWILRIYRALARDAAAFAARLEAGRAAVEDTRTRVAAVRRAILQRPDATGGAGVLLRTVLAEDTIEALYRHAGPADRRAAAARFFARAGEADILEAPHADLDALMAFCLRELAPVVETSPYEPGPSPLHAQVRDATRALLRELAVKLSPPLELDQGHTAGVPRARRVLIVPRAAVGLVETLLAEEELAGAVELVPLSGDGARLHLLVARAGIEAHAVAALREPAA